MLSLDDSRTPLPRSLLDSRGGFAWWYLDWIGPDGTSLVLIPSFGLPFLPGYASAARRGEAPTAGALPSLSVAVSRRDHSSFYLLQTYAPSRSRWNEAGMVLGDSTFDSRLVDGRRRFTAVLDCPIPGTTDRLTGTVHLDAPSIQLPEVEPGAHRWTPLGIGEATVDLRAGEHPIAQGTGRAYHDRNGCPLPLEQLGIQHWIWGRAAFEDGELIHYLLWPEDGTEPRAIALWVDRDGRATSLTPRIRSRHQRWGWFGMPWWRTLELTLPSGETAVVHSRAVVDDGPFYLRFHTRVQLGDRVASGVAEAVRPGRVDGDWMRPLVRMAVHDQTGPSSMWLPLFSGRVEDRVARLLGRRSLPVPVGSSA